MINNYIHYVLLYRTKKSKSELMHASGIPRRTIKEAKDEMRKAIKSWATDCEFRIIRTTVTNEVVWPRRKIVR